MSLVFIDDVDGTLTITQSGTNKVVSLYGKILNPRPNNPQTREVVKDNLSRGRNFNSFTQNNRESATLDFNFVNISASVLNDLKQFFFDGVDLEVIFVSGNNKGRYNFKSVLRMEPMAPTRDTNFEGTLSFVGAYVEEILED